MTKKRPSENLFPENGNFSRKNLQTNFPSPKLGARSPPLSGYIPDSLCEGPNVFTQGILGPFQYSKAKDFNQKYSRNSIFYFFRHRVPISRINMSSAHVHCAVGRVTYYKHCKHTKLIMLEMLQHAVGMQVAATVNTD